MIFKTMWIQNDLLPTRNRDVFFSQSANKLHCRTQCLGFKVWAMMIGLPKEKETT